MNHPHDPLFRWLSLIIVLAIGLLLGRASVTLPPARDAEQFRTGYQTGQNHMASGMVDPTRWHAEDTLKRLGIRTSCLPTPTVSEALPVIRSYAELEGCVYAYLQAMQTTSNREGQTPAVTTHPFVLHPGKAPLTDPTKDAYYRKLLEQGRFPISGSAEGRPR